MRHFFDCEPATPVVEMWRSVVGIAFYEVSSHGRVRSTDRVVKCADGRTRRFRGRVLAIRVDHRGYCRVHLYVDGRNLSRTVHSLVAEAFLGPRPDGHEVRHDNGDPQVNHVGNLLYGTRSDNMHDAVRHGTHANLIKATCRRSHKLEQPNLVRSALPRRDCLACARTRAWMQTHPHDDREQVADRYYKTIIGVAA